MVLTVHVLLLLVLNEGVASWLVVLLVHDDVDALDVAVLLKLPPQLALARVEVDSGHKQGSEWVRGLSVNSIVGVPDCYLLLQLVGNLRKDKVLFS